MNLITESLASEKSPAPPAISRTYAGEGHLPSDASFLEMLDIVNERPDRDGAMIPSPLTTIAARASAASCSLTINGKPHGGAKVGTPTTTCQLHMREFTDGRDHHWSSRFARAPFRWSATSMVDRSAFDRIVQAGGYISVGTGSAPDGNAIPVPKKDADLAMDAAACIGCGACVAACPNGSAMLFTSAKISHLGVLPQGQPERYDRVVKMVQQMDEEGFGGCTNIGECTAACPKEIPLEMISRMNRDLLVASFKGNMTNSESKQNGTH